VPEGFTSIQRDCTERILIEHRVVLQRDLSRLLQSADRVDDALRARLASLGATLRGDKPLVATVDGTAGAGAVLAEAMAHGARVVGVHEQRETLEELFLRDARKSQLAADA
jgi:hypothetical protein